MVATDRRTLLKAVGAGSAGLIAGCLGEEERAEGEVNVLTSYYTDTSYSGVVAADQLGYFEERDLDVTVEYTTEIDPIQVLTSNDYDVIISAHLDGIIGRARGIPVQSFVTTQANTVQSYAYDADAHDLNGVEDFPGLTLGLQNDIDITIPHEEIMGNELSDDQREDINQTFVGYDVRNLLTGQVDVLTKFPTNVDGIAMEVTGEANFGYVNMMEYIDIPGNAALTTRDFMENNRETVVEFTRCHVRGLRDSIDPEMHGEVAEAIWTNLQEEGIDDLIREDVDPIEVITQSLEMFVDFRHMDEWDTNGVGWNPGDRIMSAQDLFAEAGEVDDPSPREDLVNNEFIGEVTDSDGQLIWEE